MRGSTGLAVSVIWALLCAAPTLAAPTVVPLGGSDAAADPVGRCGALATLPYEGGKPGGLADDAVLLVEALDACEAAHAADPHSAEAETWLGRVYVLIGRAADAAPLLEDAVAQGSPVAAYLLSKNLSDGTYDGIEDDAGRAFELLRQAADAGYAPAAFDLGQHYETADDADYAEAKRLYEQASGQGLGMAAYKLGFMAHAGYLAEADFGKAMALYEQAVTQGEPAGSYGIGQLYQYGQGVTLDYARAVEAYQAGADTGEMMSQTALAYLYEQGLGVAQDFSRSFALLTAAADQNYGYAQAALALHYLFGEGTAVDADKAYGLAWAAVQKGVTYANGIVGYMYAEGLGTERDLSSALSYFQTGADAGDQYSASRVPATGAEIACQDAAGSPYEPGGSGHGREFEAIEADAAIAACLAALEANPGSVGDGVWLAQGYIKGGRISDALPLLEAGSAAGNVLALTSSGMLLLSGDGVDPDPAAAIGLFEQASAKNFAPALLALGQLYAAGDLVPRDRARALDYLQRALEAGMEAAGGELAELESTPDTPANPDLEVGFGEAGPAY